MPDIGNVEYISNQGNLKIPLSSGLGVCVELITTYGWICPDSGIEPVNPCDVIIKRLRVGRRRL